MAEKKKAPSPEITPEKKPKGNILLKIPLWVLTVLMLTVAVSFFPSLSSLLAFLAAMLLLPMEGAQRVWRRWNIKGGVKAILFVVLFLVAFSTAPSLEQQNTPDKPEDSSLSLSDTRGGGRQQAPTQPEKSSQQEELPQESDPPAKMPQEENHAEPEPEPEKEPEPKEGPQPDPEPQPNPEPEPEPEKEPETPGNSKNENPFNTYDIPEQQQTEDQWVLNENSHKIHYRNCREVKKIKPENYNTSNLSESELLSQGYTVCKVCH